MPSQPPERLPPGVPTWESFSGARVGIIAGGLIGVGVMILFSLASIWLIFGGAAVGGVLGYFVGKRRRRSRPPDTSR